MLIDPFAGHPHRRRAWREGIGLAFAAPFLIFPTTFVWGTLVGLLLISGIWLWPLPGKKPLWLPRTPLNVVLLGWVLCLGMAILVTADPDLTLPKATNLILGLTLWRTLAWVSSTPRVIGWSLAAYLLLGVAFTLVGSVSTRYFVKIPELAPFLPPQLLSLPGNAEAGVQANQLAGTILLYWPLLLSLLLAAGVQRYGGRAAKAAPGVSRTPHRILDHVFVVALPVTLAAAAIAALFVLVLTQSRSGWSGGAGALLLLVGTWAWLLPPTRLRFLLRLLLFLALLAGFAGVLVVGPAQIAGIWQDPVQETAVGNLGTLNFRKEVWRWGIAAIADFPLTGTGLGSFRRVLHRFYPTRILPEIDVAHAHNIFLQVALDVGLPGLVVYLAMLLLVTGMGWRVARRHTAWRGPAIGLLGSLAALHIFGLADVMALGAKPALLFWMALGIVTGMYGFVCGPDADAG